MSDPNHALEASVAPYLTPDKVARFRQQVGLQPDTNLTPNEYRAYLQVYTWAVLAHLNRAGRQLTEESVSPIVDSTLQTEFTVLPRDLGFPDVIPSWIRSRVVWYTTREISLI